MNYPEFKEVIQTMMLEMDIDFEQYPINHDAALDICISTSYENAIQLINNIDLTLEEKLYSMMASVAYLNLENFYLRLSNGK